MQNESKEKDGLTVDEYEPLDMDDLQEKKFVVVASKKALDDVLPIQWDNAVTLGQLKVLLVADKSIRNI